jgi:hypothetical protein
MNVEFKDTFVTHEFYATTIKNIFDGIDKNFAEIEARLSKLEELNTKS